MSVSNRNSSTLSSRWRIWTWKGHRRRRTGAPGRWREKKCMWKTEGKKAWWNMALTETMTKKVADQGGKARKGHGINRTSKKDGDALSVRKGHSCGGYTSEGKPQVRYILWVGNNRGSGRGFNFLPGPGRGNENNWLGDTYCYFCDRFFNKTLIFCTFFAVLSALGQWQAPTVNEVWSK